MDAICYAKVATIPSGRSRRMVIMWRYRATGKFQISRPNGSVGSSVSPPPRESVFGCKPALIIVNTEGISQRTQRYQVSGLKHVWRWFVNISRVCDARWRRSRMRSWSSCGDAMTRRCSVRRRLMRMWTSRGWRKTPKGMMDVADLRRLLLAFSRVEGPGGAGL